MEKILYRAGVLGTKLHGVMLYAERKYRRNYFGTRQDDGTYNVYYYA